jgi:hypothetical protein
MPVDASRQANPAPLQRIGCLRAISEPRLTTAWTLGDWDRVVRLARRHRLLARLAASIQSAGLMPSVPAQVRNHLIAACHQSLARTRAMLWAIEWLPRALNYPSFPLVLLKGSAYLGQDLPIAEGRLPSDLDILVPRKNLAEVRFLLRAAGWVEPPLDDHDLRYYLEWSHELPPMRHGAHPIELDVHHNILPPRAGKTLDADLLFERLHTSQWAHWQVLSPVDQLLHCASHLFFDSEPRDRVRDLVDMDGLFRHFGSTPAFWQELPARAASLKLLEPLALACHFARAWLDTPIAEDLSSKLGSEGPDRSRMRWLIPLMSAVLMPTEPDDEDSATKKLAMTIVLARYHSHRLPMRTLVPHLWRKWRLARPQPEDAMA